jgi:hypothetical protein
MACFSGLQKVKDCLGTAEPGKSGQEPSTHRGLKELLGLGVLLNIT